jgi:hypothetical protein
LKKRLLLCRGSPRKNATKRLFTNLAGNGDRIGRNNCSPLDMASLQKHGWARPTSLHGDLISTKMLHSKNWSYIQLTHAPHEGASFFYQPFFHFIRPFQSFLPSLSLAALLIDALWED